MRIQARRWKGTRKEYGKPLPPPLRHTHTPPDPFTLTVETHALPCMWMISARIPNAHKLLDVPTRPVTPPICIVSNRERRPTGDGETSTVVHSLIAPSSKPYSPLRPLLLLRDRYPYGISISTLWGGGVGGLTGTLGPPSHALSRAMSVLASWLG